MANPSLQNEGRTPSDVGSNRRARRARAFKLNAQPVLMENDVAFNFTLPRP